MAREGVSMEDLIMVVFSLWFRLNKNELYGLSVDEIVDQFKNYCDSLQRGM